MRRNFRCFLMVNAALMLTACTPFDLAYTGIASQRHSGHPAPHPGNALNPGDTSHAGSAPHPGRDSGSGDVPTRPQFPTLHPGDEGALVEKVQSRLDRLGFKTGPPGSEYGPALRMAVWAFQKANGLPAVDRVDPPTWQALSHPERVRPLVPSGGSVRVEIDLRRQLLTAWKDGKPALITHISTGTGKPYCKNGHCGVAVTPTGDFRAWWRTAGWTSGPLGDQFYTVYFNGGIGFHGSERVPRHPASHGCIRVPLHNARPLFDMIQTGHQVYVRRPA